MHVQNANKNVLQALILLLLLVALSADPVLNCAQEPIPETKNYIRIGHEFLRALYPELNEKGYSITIETSLAYDDLKSVPKYFMLDVGAGPKFVVLECCIQGYAGGTLPTPSLPGSLDSEASASPRSSQAEKREKYWDAEGRVHPKQYLSTGFRFDDSGRLASFTADGPAIGNREADNKLIDLVNSRPGMSEQDIAAELKRLGAKYGPGDKEQFVKDLPLNELGRFLGKPELTSVNFSSLDSNRRNLGLWPNWEVTVLVTEANGTKLSYKATFDHFKGKLSSLSMESSKNK